MFPQKSSIIDVRQALKYTPNSPGTTEITKSSKYVKKQENCPDSFSP